MSLIIKEEYITSLQKFKISRFALNIFPKLSKKKKKDLPKVFRTIKNSKFFMGVYFSKHPDNHKVGSACFLY